MRTILCFFAGLAAVGLALSMVSHIAAIFGKQGPLGDHTSDLHVGVFVVWLPTVLVANRLARNYPQKDLWKAVLRGCPEWMRYMTYGLFGYAFLNFAYFLFVVPKDAGSGSMPPPVVRWFSGHWMIFYSAALAVLYSGHQLWDQDWERLCPNGHALQPLAKFCDQCGIPTPERR